MNINTKELIAYLQMNTKGVGNVIASRLEVSLLAYMESITPILVYAIKATKTTKRRTILLEPTQDDEEDQCDFCDKQKHHLVKRDAGYDEWTCKDCYKEQYDGEEEDECHDAYVDKLFDIELNGLLTALD